MREIVTNAADIATAVHALVQEIREDGYGEGYEQGHNDGYNAGLKDGYVDAKKKTDPTFDRLREEISRLEAQLNEQAGVDH